MAKWSVIFVIVLAGCAKDMTEYKCINGALYKRESDVKQWVMVDGTPFTPGLVSAVPCVESK